MSMQRCLALTRLENTFALCVSSNRTFVQPRIQFRTCPAESHISAESHMGYRVGNTIPYVSSYPSNREGPSSRKFTGIDNFVLRSVVCFRIRNCEGLTADQFHSASPPAADNSARAIVIFDLKIGVRLTPALGGLSTCLFVHTKEAL